MAAEHYPEIALVAPPDLPPEEIIRAAHEAEAAGLDGLWLWEDCFATSGLAPAAAALAATARIHVGVGLMPAPLRAPSLTAMEVASLARMFPGRFRPGLGHGVQEWMRQAGVRVASPLTLLREQVEAINALLAGQNVTRQGRYVHLDGVELRWPPRSVPGVLIGGRGPKTLALAGEIGDGVILDDVAPSGEVDLERTVQAIGEVRSAWYAAGRTGAPNVVALMPAPDGVTTDQLSDRIARLGEAGVTTVTVVAGSLDGPIAGDERVFALAKILGDIA